MREKRKKKKGRGVGGREWRDEKKMVNPLHKGNG